jgi:hypothetical protein
MGSRYMGGVGKACNRLGSSGQGDASCCNDTYYLTPSLLAGLVEHPRSCHERPERSGVYPQRAVDG